MIDIYKLIYDTLTPLGYDVRQQGSYSENEELPDTFITYWLKQVSPSKHYDGEISSYKFQIQIVFYSIDAELLQAADTLIRSVMSPANFMYASGEDITFREITNRYAYGMRFNYYYKEE